MMASPSIGRCGSSRPTLRALIPTAACALTPRPTPPRRPCMARGCCSAAARWCRPISRPVGSCGPSASSSRRARTTTSSPWPAPCASAKSAPSATGCSRKATWTTSRAKGDCMQGIELSQRFYVEIVAPWLARTAPGLEHAAALLGYGSELLGFDDETSRDHNWGPRDHLILSQQDFQKHAHRMVDEFAIAAPTQFAGEPIGWRSRPHPPSPGLEAVGDLRHGLDIHTLGATLDRVLGIRSVDGLTPIQWLSFAAQRLLAFTGGAV